MLRKAIYLLSKLIILFRKTCYLKGFNSFFASSTLDCRKIQTKLCKEVWCLNYVHEQNHVYWVKARIIFPFFPQMVFFNKKGHFLDLG